MCLPLDGAGLLVEEYDIGAVRLVRIDDQAFEERISARNAEIFRETRRWVTELKRIWRKRFELRFAKQRTQGRNRACMLVIADASARLFDA